MDAFQRHYPHLDWPWWRRKYFVLRYDLGMALSVIRTRIYGVDAQRIGATTVTVQEWLKQFVRRYKRETGKEPTPLDLAHNLGDMSESDAMTAMVKFMERK